MYFNAVAGALDLCQYRLAAGELDDEAGAASSSSYCDLAHFVPPGYARPRRRTRSSTRSTSTSLTLLDGMRRRPAGVPRGARRRGAGRRRCWSWLEEQEGYLLKPMNCPHHIQIYKAEPHSYRDLPVRLAEFGTVYRFEQTGELGGMTRVRGFTQDDAHLFVTPEQVEAELRAQHRPGAVRPARPWA